MIPEAAPLPTIPARPSWRMIAAEARDNAAENKRRLESAARNYEALKKSYEAVE